MGRSYEEDGFFAVSAAAYSQSSPNDMRRFGAAAVGAFVTATPEDDD